MMAYGEEYSPSLSKIPTADVVPKSEEGAECPICHGTGRIGTTDWLTKNISKKQLAEEKAKAIAEHEAEHERHIKTEVAREILREIDDALSKFHCYEYGVVRRYIPPLLIELKKKYIKGD